MDQHEYMRLREMLFRHRVTIRKGLNEMGWFVDVDGTAESYRHFKWTARRKAKKIVRRLAIPVEAVPS